MSRKSGSFYQNLFGETDNAALARWGRWRTKVMRPLLIFLTDLHVSPNAISLLSFLCAIVGAAVLVSNTVAAAAFMIMHLLLDTVDGALARHQKKASARGMAVDFIADTAGFIVFAAAAFYFTIADPFLLGWYVISYLLLLKLITRAAKTEKSPRIILRTKDFFFLVVGLELLFGLKLIDSFLLLFAIYNTTYMVQLFWLTGRRVPS